MAVTASKGSERLLTADEVAEIIGMRVDYVFALSRRNQIPHLRFGRTLRFRADAIESWLRAAERGSLARSM
jgi:excisionase family DNA binding protein